MRTLVVHIGGIGDLLLACPAIRRLAQDGPVELTGNRERLGIAVAGGLADAAHDMDTVRIETLFTEPDRRLRDFLRRFDRAVLWIRDEGALERNLRRCGLQDVRLFPGLPPKDWRAHASSYYLACLGIEQAPPLRLAIEPAPGSLDVIIHPGSGGRHKNWPLDRFQALAEMLASAGRNVSWRLGPAEEGFPLGPESNIIRSQSLLTLARDLAAARLYIGNDSGITHLSTAVGCATIAIFGPTDPRVWAPLGDHVTVVQGSPWPTVRQVLDALRKIEPGLPETDRTLSIS